MMRKLLKLILLIGLFLFGLKVFIVLNAHIMLSDLKERFKNDVLLTYDWISSDLSGSVIIEDIEVTPYALKKTFKVETLVLEYPGLSDLLNNLSGLDQLNIGNLKSIQMPFIESELKGISLRERLKQNYGAGWLGLGDLFACDHVEGPDSKRYNRMGLDDWSASLTIEFRGGEDEGFSIDLDQYDFGRYKFNASMSDAKLRAFLKSGSIKDLSFNSIQLEHQESGLFRRLNALCNQSQIQDRSLFSAQAALDWKQAMLAQGLKVNDETLKLYARYLLQGGSISISLTPEQTLDFNNTQRLLDKDLVTELNVGILLNGEKIPNLSVYLDSSILYPPPPVTELVQTNEPVFEPGFYAFDLLTLEQHLEKKIRVTMLSEKVYEGVLTEFTEYNLELSQNLPGGVVNYPLMLNEIKVFEVWLNSRP